MLPIYKLTVKNYTPKTSHSQKDTPRKAELREIIKQQNNSIEEIKRGCRGKNLSLDITFKLYDSNDGTAYKTDLDNLLKILLDVLKEKNSDNSITYDGIGIIQDDHDYLIHEIKCKKEIVHEMPEAGFTIKISEFHSNKT
ncbi:MAG: hypothetical protein FJ360_03845 [Thaumarchaeota archaeon]|nr:hypothetical protein [Nitrososphaerota archaeon]